MDPFIFDLNYIEKVPSLRKLSSIRLVFELWKTVDISSTISDQSWKYYARNEDLRDTNNFEILVEDVISRVDSYLPNTLIDKVNYFTMYVGLHLCEWLDLMNGLIFDLSIHDILQFTSLTVYGAVDEYKSVQSLVRKFGHQVIRAAFYFCLENEALKMLSEGIPSDIQKYCDNCDVDTSSNILMKFWVFKHQKRLSEFSLLMKNSKLIDVTRQDFTESDFLEKNINILMTKVSVLTANSNAAEYFFSKLEDEEKALNVDSFCELAIESDSFNRDGCPKYFQAAYFFYLQMQPSRRKLIFTTYKENFLFSMINYFGFQNQITTTISSFWDTFELDLYADIFGLIIQRLLDEKFVIASLLESICHVIPEDTMRQFFAFVASELTCDYLFENSIHHITGRIVQKATTSERNIIFSFCEI